jgi:hypothetical protein
VADDFTGVPSADWRRVESQVAFARTLGLWALLLAVLVVLALIEKGVFTGWGDLVARAAAGE